MPYKRIEMAAQSFRMQPSKDIGPAQLAKESQRIKAIFSKYKLHDELQRIVCEKIIIDPNNRDGQPPDMQYLHCKLEPDQEKDEWLETRPKSGILVKLTDPARRRRAIDHNVKLMEGTEGLCHPLHESLIEYSCLAANQLTLSHRGMKAHMRSCITGKVWGDADGRAMKTLLAHGHKYYIVSDEIIDEEAKELSDAQNADQNQNARSDDGQNVRKVL